MIDFKKILLDKKNKTGIYAPPLASGTLSGRRNGKPYNVNWEVRKTDYNGKLLFKILNGVTGFESWYLESICPHLLENPLGEVFHICAGGMGWDTLFVSTKEVQDIIRPFWENRHKYANQETE